jgi:hypothetical protein
MGWELRLRWGGWLPLLVCVACAGAKPADNVAPGSHTNNAGCSALPELRRLDDWDRSRLFADMSRAAVLAYPFGARGEVVVYGVDVGRGTVAWGVIVPNGRVAEALLEITRQAEAGGIEFTLSRGKVGPPPPPPGDPTLLAADLVRVSRALAREGDTRPASCRR